jgi:hypothetical protein
MPTGSSTSPAPKPRCCVMPAAAARSSSGAGCSSS